MKVHQVVLSFYYLNDWYSLGVSYTLVNKRSKTVDLIDKLDPVI